MKIRSFLSALGASAVLLSGCALLQPPAPVAPLKDGELAIPADYKSWPKFLSEVQRPDAKQVRDIYMNPVATQGTQAGGFPNGSVFVMENYAAKVDADGKPLVGADGKLVKGNLLRVFLMGKNEGWGQSAPEGLKNGDWIYAGYLGNGDKAPEPASACRTCHLPLTQSKDFVYRYDEYFGKVASK
ncbi:MAG TPA: cytochrome P460 family protein [Burkholderiaceae bacterium]|nr:cytochrome P460 family protein [Burkholderiaceae bacterium]